MHRTSSHLGIHIPVVFILLTCQLTCHSAPKVVTESSPVSSRPLPSAQSVYMLPAYVIVEDVHTGEAVAAHEAENVSKAAMLNSAVVRQLRAGGLTVIGEGRIDDSTPGELGEVLAQLQAKHKIVASAYRDQSETRPLFLRLRGLTGADLACVITLRIKEGSSTGVTLPGYVREGSASVEVRAALVSLVEGKHIWGRDVFSRRAASDATVAECVEKMFRSSSSQGKSQ